MIAGTMSQLPVILLMTGIGAAVAVHCGTQETPPFPGGFLDQKEY